MTLRHFEIFQAVAHTGSFTKAARKLYITQSAVSHAIRDLEETSGTALFDRLSKSVQLTRSGQLLLSEITPILTSYEALEAHIHCLEQQAPLHIASSITIAAFWLPKILQRFSEKFPQQMIQVEVVSAGAAMEILCSGKADIALIEGARPQGAFSSVSFASYPLEIVCSPCYQSISTPMSLECFCTQKLLLREKGSAIRDTLESALYLSGFTARPIWTSVNSLALIEAAKAGLGITVLPDVLVAEAIAKQELIPLTVNSLSLKNEMLAVWHEDKYLTKPLQYFISLCQK